MLASFLIFVVFFGFDDKGKKKEADTSIDFQKFELNSKMGGEKYWCGLLDDLDTTADDIYFTGRKLKLWYKNIQCRETLLEKLKKREEKQVNNKVYFILHDLEYMQKWDQLFRDNNLNVCIAYLPGENCYSIVRCGKKIVIILRTFGAREDSPTIEVSTGSGIGKFFIEYVKELIATNHIE